MSTFSGYLKLRTRKTGSRRRRRGLKRAWTRGGTSRQKRRRRKLLHNSSNEIRDDENMKERHSVHYDASGPLTLADT
ncbi:hypothetical protein RRG08_063269 [Elysia crispata]|uniref:Uncharacterized protein n=1 Tax=Elysia crispata TaxID=231223 RepID=A0AAE1CJJ7_9GAST|nr:hypothetical protein RRG08_063269 [Elysia crispata]